MTVYTSALRGLSGLEAENLQRSMIPLLDLVVAQVPPPPVDIEGFFQMQISSLAHSNYEGVMGVGRVRRGRILSNSPILVIDRDGNQRKAKILNIYGYKGLYCFN